ncbi:DUF2798 domain-containing protein [Paraburkholderia largidicola]|uniref:DUF2798 domain-containing protein n=1 Tax=Paraburkholderia largidicola TaxID=3014751 RepID=A0A7I8C1S5_9BURK|nr:DUF2798 domain-containing protein [Paraburkholderia sp. PGU16]BCF95036.1 hypothetical protein PPGU16_81030 [Paraburkholderia sp. PGU16]
MRWKIPGEYGHYVYGTIQSDITCAVGSGIASIQFYEGRALVSQWLGAYLVSWGAMLPVVVFAAPLIRWLTNRITN